jgi:hypothetical protein
VRLVGIEEASSSISSSDDLESDSFRFDAPDAEAPAPDAGEGGMEPEPDAGEGDEGGTEPDAGEPPSEDAGQPFVVEDDCPIGYYRVEGSALVCAPKNPWRSRSNTWTATYRGRFSSGFTAAIEQGAGEGELLMQRPEGFDFCERGTEQDGRSALVIISDPEDDTPEYCDRDEDEPWRFLVREAYQDHLVLEMAPEVTGPGGDLATLDDLRVCFTDFSGFELRFADRWRVSVGESAYTHRMMTGADGRCVVDTSIDPRWDEQTSFSQPYWDPYIAFQLRPPDEDTPEAKENINPSITLDLEAGPLSVRITTGPRYDTLPVRTRAFPESGYLFVVDAASQGLTPVLTWPQYEIDKTYH